MPKNQAPPLFKLLSNDLRWGLLKALSSSDLRVLFLCIQNSAR